MKNITVLGVTGSIGTQTIDVVLGHPDEFKIVAMKADQWWTHDPALTDKAIRRSILQHMFAAMRGRAG